MPERKFELQHRSICRSCWVLRPVEETGLWMRGRCSLASKWHPAFPMRLASWSAQDFVQMQRDRSSIVRRGCAGILSGRGEQAYGRIASLGSCPRSGATATVCARSIRRLLQGRCVGDFEVTGKRSVRRTRTLRVTAKTCQHRLNFGSSAYLVILPLRAGSGQNGIGFGAFAAQADEKQNAASRCWRSDAA